MLDRGVGRGEDVEGPGGGVVLVECCGGKRGVGGVEGGEGGVEEEGEVEGEDGEGEEGVIGGGCEVGCAGAEEEFGGTGTVSFGDLVGRGWLREEE